MRTSKLAVLGTTLTLLAVVSTAGCSSEIDEEALEGVESTEQAQAATLAIGTTTVFATVVGSGALLSAPVTIPTTAIVVSVVAVAGAFVFVLSAQQNGDVYNADGSVYRNGQLLVRSPAPPTLRGTAVRAYSLDGTTVVLATSAQATATATATATTGTSQQCQQLNNQYHQGNACNGPRSCGGLSGPNNCPDIQARYLNAKRCYELRTQYNQQCLGGATASVRQNHLAEASTALAHMQQCQNIATNPYGYGCPGFSSSGAAPVPNPTPRTTCDNGVGVAQCTVANGTLYKCKNPNGLASGTSGNTNSSHMWQLCGGASWASCQTCSNATPPPPANPTCVNGVLLNQCATNAGNGRRYKCVNPSGNQNLTSGTGSAMWRECPVGTSSYACC